ncbi:MAG: arginine--tRNA ligase [Caldilineaceae bacterium]|nr:arginine--tRNA ligase [Caldilineaceae bacterium]
MIRDHLTLLIEQALTKAQAAGALATFALPAVEIARPKQVDHGDYSTNIAMVVAAALRKATGEKANPRAIAEAVIAHLPASDLIGGVELAGPGFINLRLADSWLQAQVATIVQAGERFGNLTQGVGQRWQVEFVSVNPTGPIHYGGARNAVLGDSLANVLTAAGYAVQREFYVNDRGNQVQLFAETLWARYLQHFGQAVSIPENGYQGEYMHDYAGQLAEQYGDRFVTMAPAQAIAELEQIGLAIVIRALQSELARIGVHFDNWFSEQSLYDSGLLQQALDYLEQRGELAHRDGAVWFLASKYPKNEKDEVVIRSNGSPSYFASDIAYHYDKFLRRHFDHVINVWGVDHQGHVPRMAAVMQSLGLEPARLSILLYDLVKLIRDGKEVKLSKRAGNLITINDVVDEVGADAIRFNLLTRSPESTIEFDLDLAVAQTNDNPVYYVQYSHARICSILAKATAEGLNNGDMATLHSATLQPLGHPSELALIRKLLELEEQIELAIERLSPHNLTHYVLELAKTFNGFYRDCRVVDRDQPAVSAARLQLCVASRIVLAKVLHLIGVSAPETM